MKLLLTSSGITNVSLRRGLEGLLGKPISEAKALFVPTGMYPYRGGAELAWRAIAGKNPHPMCSLGWKRFGNLELSVLASIDREAWVPQVEEADALLVWGGDPLFLSHWFRASGLAALLPSLRPEQVYVGTSAGAMCASAVFGEAYTNPPRHPGEALTREDIVLGAGPDAVRRTFVTARGLGLVDFALIPHLGSAGHEDASEANAEAWAARIPAPVYAIDDQTGLQVIDGEVEPVSEGKWRFFAR